MGVKCWSSGQEAVVSQRQEILLKSHPPTSQPP